MNVYKCVLFVLTTFVAYLVLRFSGIIAELSLIFIAIHLANCIIHWIKDPFHENRLLPGLNGKAVLITGCDTGFGNKLARKLDSIGVTVFAGCLFPEGPGAQELRTVCSKYLHIIPLDITNEEQVSRAVKYVDESLGDKRRFTINGLVPYSMSKHALVSLADGLRREMMKFEVTVHCVEPWMYRTDLNSSKCLEQHLNENWSQASEDVTSDYGEGYLKNYSTFLADVEQHYQPASKVSDVVDALVDASVGENPKMRYELGIVWVLRLLMFFPSQWLDYFTFITSPDSNFKK